MISCCGYLGCMKPFDCLPGKSVKETNPRWMGLHQDRGLMGEASGSRTKDLAQEEQKPTLMCTYPQADKTHTNKN